MLQHPLRPHERSFRLHAGRSETRCGLGSTVGADYVVGSRNRWSRVMLSFERLTAGQWYEFSAYVVCDGAESASDARDFAMLGVVFLSQDGSEIDFARVPGLARTSMDAHGDWLAGPAWEGGAGARGVSVRRCFYLPLPPPGWPWSSGAGATRTPSESSVPRSGRPARARPPQRTRPLTGPLHRGPAGPGRTDRPRSPSCLVPAWPRPGAPARLPGAGDRAGADGGRPGPDLLPRCRRQPDPAPLPRHPVHAVGSGLPGHPGPPTGLPLHSEGLSAAAGCDPGDRFGTWEADPGLALAAAPDALLDDDLRLANLTDDADPGAEAVLARLLGRLGPLHDGGAGAGSIRPYLDAALLAERPSPLRSFARLRDKAEACVWAEGAIRLASRPAWPLPDVPDWAPTRSGRRRGAWRSSPWTGPGALPRVRSARFGSARSPSPCPGPARTLGANRRIR